MTMPKVEDSKIGAAVNCLLILGLFASCWYWGWQIGATALTDPDSCWLIAVGKWIAAHHALPTVDPFSYTVGTTAPPALLLQPAHYVPYQWLASLIFYGIFQSFGPSALLYLVCLLVLTAFLLLPLLLAKKLGTPLPWQFLLSAVAINAGSFHFPLRPELFSYLFIALLFYYWLPSLVVARFDYDKIKFATLTAATFGFALFSLWANLHSGFVLGLLVAVVFLLTKLFQLIVVRKNTGNAGSIKSTKNPFVDCAPLLAFTLAGGLGTLLTPFQLALYDYLPGLFFSPTNRFNQELMPLQFSELLGADYLPFFFLQICFVLTITATIIFSLLPRSRHNVQLEPLCALLCLAPLALFACIAGDFCRRMIPFAVLMSLAYFLVLTYLFAQAPMLKIGLKARFAWSIKWILPTAVVAAFWGTAASISIFPVDIPQITYGFDVPKGALAFILENRPEGNMLNDPQFGDLLIFAADEKARVFIDTRFDLYGPKLCRDYFVMANALNGYESLIERYKIDWVFLPPRARLWRRLMETGRWHIERQDKAAVILTRLRPIRSEK